MPLGVVTVDPSKDHINFQCIVQQAFQCQVVLEQDGFFILRTGDLVANDWIFFVEIVSNKKTGMP
ncbi:hypothetical protein VK98_04710 [Chromobacterium sp. LK11]|nr:hypothetical protein VK98_04710 [Chromobacterium sp. LK11]